MSSFRSLSVAMLKGFVRDRVSLFFTFLFPMMFLVVFGLLFRDAGDTRTELAVVGDGPVVEALESTGAVELQRFSDAEAAVEQVRNGDLPGALLIRDEEVELRFAASDQARAGMVQGLVNGVVNQLNLAATGQPPALQLRIEQVEDTSLKPIQYIAPSILSWGIAVSASFGAALTLVSWRRKQVLRRIRLSPVPVTTVLTSRLLVTIGIAVVQAVLFTLVALTPVFGLQLNGQWWLTLPLLVAGVLAFFAMGMLAGAFTKTEEAASGVVNVVVLPMAFLSGTFFDINAAPAWLQTVSVVMPLRHMNDGMLDVMVRGQGAEALLLPIGVLLGFTLVVGAIAARLFRWEDN